MFRINKLLNGIKTNPFALRVHYFLTKDLPHLVGVRKNKPTTPDQKPTHQQLPDLDVVSS
jgi:hypothetical protein